MEPVVGGVSFSYIDNWQEIELDLELGKSYYVPITVSYNTKCYSLENLQQAIAQDPEQWRPLVFTNGCFDLLHVGHIRYLSLAKSLGKKLVVGLNSDRSVKQIKPPSPGLPPRPIIPELQRAELLTALKAVDRVAIFDQPTAIEVIQALQPEIYVKGGDYQLSNLPEASAVQAYGGRIELVTIEIPTSTTAIIKKILTT